MTIEDKFEKRLSKGSTQVISSVMIGAFLGILLLIFGYYSYTLLKPAISTSGSGILEMFGIVFMLSIIAGYYFGISITQEDHNYFLFFSFFAVVMVSTVVFGLRDFGYLFVIPPAFAVLLGWMVLNKNIRFDKNAGLLLQFSSKMAMGGIGAIFHAIIVEPFVQPYLGPWSPVTWIWVVIAFILLILKFGYDLDNMEFVS